MTLAVADYTDCDAQAPLTRSAAARDWCEPQSVVLLLGHSPGPFSSLVRARPGDLVFYWDAARARHDYSIAFAVRSRAADDEQYYRDSPYPHLVLHTCAVPDGSEVLDLVASPVP